LIYGAPTFYFILYEFDLLLHRMMELRRRQTPAETPAGIYSISSTRPGPGRGGLAAAPGEHPIDTGARSKGWDPWQN